MSSLIKRIVPKELLPVLEKPAKLAATIAERAGCKRIVLWHFYPGCDEFDINLSCRQYYKGETIVAEDMMQIFL